MGALSLFKEAGNEKGASDFVTPASLLNFAAMTGAISAAWAGLQKLNSPLFSSVWVPFAFAVAWGVVSVWMSIESYRKDPANPALGWKGGELASGIFIALLNSLVLTSAVIGAGLAVGLTNQG